MSDLSVEEAALRWAQNCIHDWADEEWFEVNEVLGTKFTDKEMQEVCKLAATAIAVLPADLPRENMPRNIPGTGDQA